jgi:16S rRNA (adenine1518-N6/adenine1519-N6)-dimethyltransferase
MSNNQSDSKDAKKSLGQHWLKDSQKLNHICDIALVHEHDTILEVGPGKGTLTQELLNRGAQVIAVELDRNLHRFLSANFDSPRLVLVNEDIMKFDLRKMPSSYKVVANIPYYLTSHLIRILTESTNPPKSVTLLIQKEVAERIVASPGDMSILSVSAQFYYDVELGEVVPSQLFSPPPKVDSQVVHMLRKPSGAHPKVDTALLFRVVKAGFAGRRKTLLNSLSAGLHIDKAKARQILEASGTAPGTRSQELSIDQWVKLCESYERYS